MALSIPNNLIQRSYRWSDWKDIQKTKSLIYQYDDDGIVYSIWGYDGPEIHITTIWKTIVPDGVIQGGYSQSQNNSDKSDFENNYLSNANRAVNPDDASRNSIYEASVSNCGSPVSQLTTFLAVSLRNPNSNYKHPAGTKKLKIFGIDGFGVKTNVTDLWIYSIGVILSMGSTSSTVAMIRPGNVYLADTGGLKSSATTFQFPIPIDCEVVSGTLTRITGCHVITINGVGTSAQIKDASGAMVTAEVGDLIVRAAPVTDASGLTIGVPVGTGLFQYHIWYVAE